MHWLMDEVGCLVVLGVMSDGGSVLMRYFERGNGIICGHR